MMKKTKCSFITFEYLHTFVAQFSCSKLRTIPAKKLHQKEVSANIFLFKILQLCSWRLWADGWGVIQSHCEHCWTVTLACPTSLITIIIIMILITIMIMIVIMILITIIVIVIMMLISVMMLMIFETINKFKQVKSNCLCFKDKSINVMTI